MKKDVLLAYQYLRLKKFELIVFDYILYEDQIKVIYTLYYKQKNLLLLGKIGFGKNLIF